jgi:hypothetical protein
MRKELTLHQAAELANKSTSSIKRYAQLGILPYHLSIHGRAYWEEDILTLDDKLSSNLQKRGRKPRRE